jgi:hypothetical protein
MNGAGAARVTLEVLNHGRGEDAFEYEDGSSILFRNFGIFLQDHTVSRPRRQHSEHHLKI